MSFLFTLFFFLFGLIIGSFLNVVIYRYNTGYTLGGRSKCLSCGKTLKWFELIPLFSYIFQKGKCAKCEAHISHQYPLVELSTGLLFALLYFNIKSLVVLNPILFVELLILEMIISALLVVIFVYDIRHKIIPNGLVYAFSAISLVHLFVNTPVFLYTSKAFIWDLLAGPILFLPFYTLWRVSSGRWIGLGDGKLALGMGWFLGLVLGFSAVIISFWLGAIVSVGILLITRLNRGGKHITMKTEVPFAPFLIIGTFLAFFFNLDVLSIGLLLNF